jgi:hypothetical protein
MSLDISATESSPLPESEDPNDIVPAGDKSRVSVSKSEDLADIVPAENLNPVSASSESVDGDGILGAEKEKSVSASGSEDPDDFVPAEKENPVSAPEGDAFFGAGKDSSVSGSRSKGTFPVKSEKPVLLRSGGCGDIFFLEEMRIRDGVEGICERYLCCWFCDIRDSSLGEVVGKVVD